MVGPTEGTERAVFTRFRGLVDSLIADLGAAIKDADTFIKEMDADKAATGTQSK